MSTVLIGHTGFVGSNLAAAHDFDICVNSSTIGDLRSGDFDTIICAGVSAVKWKANKDPEADALSIKRLTDVLDTVTARRMILISTVDVFKLPDGVDERVPVETEGLPPYGLHRLLLERRLAERFPTLHILRLPALFGSGLRKNIIFDLMHDNMLEVINPESRFQWYPTARLWSDIQTVVSAGIPLAHFASEPLSTSEILARYFPHKIVGTAPAARASYDFQTCQAAAFGKSGRYMMSKDDVLSALGAYLVGAHA
jgi:nucleoside-diphosphate-sugar epimerase